MLLPQLQPRSNREIILGMPLVDQTRISQRNRKTLPTLVDLLPRLRRTTHSRVVHRHSSKIMVVGMLLVALTSTNSNHRNSKTTLPALIHHPMQPTNLQMILSRLHLLLSNDNKTLLTLVVVNLNLFRLRHNRTLVNRNNLLRRNNSLVTLADNSNLPNHSRCSSNHLNSNSSTSNIRRSNCHHPLTSTILECNSNRNRNMVFPDSNRVLVVLMPNDRSQLSQAWDNP